jgi:hypothetical protein
MTTDILSCHAADKPGNHFQSCLVGREQPLDSGERLGRRASPFRVASRAAVVQGGQVILSAVPAPLAGSAVSAFRAFLGRTAAGFAIFGEGDPPEQRSWWPKESFGILNRAERSVALWGRGELLAYGGASALRVLAQAYANWPSYGLPGLADFALQVVRIGSPPVGRGEVWEEPRGETALFWRLLPGAKDWQALLRDAP